MFRDAKTRLQEYLQRDGETLIEYRDREETEAGQDRVFSAQVLAEGVVLGSGRGHNKKQAEQEAASAALRQLLSDRKTNG